MQILNDRKIKVREMLKVKSVKDAIVRSLPAITGIKRNTVEANSKNKLKAARKGIEERLMIRS